MKYKINFSKVKREYTSVEIDTDLVFPKEIYKFEDGVIVTYKFTGKIDHAFGGRRALYEHGDEYDLEKKEQYIFFEVSEDGTVKVNNRYTLDKMIEECKECIVSFSNGIDHYIEKVAEWKANLESAEKMKKEKENVKTIKGK